MSEQPVLKPFDAGAPAGLRALPSQRIDRRALRVWRITGAIWTLLAALAAGGATFILRLGDIDWLMACLPLLGVPPLAIVLIWVVPRIRWERWRYQVSEREIDLQYGVWIISRTLIPLSRVQHVDTRQGPIMRHYGVASVAIATAAGTLEIPALDLEEASMVRDRIAELAGVAEDV